MYLHNYNSTTYIFSYNDGPFHYHIKTNDKNQVSLSDKNVYFDNLIKLIEVSYWYCICNYIFSIYVTFLLECGNVPFKSVSCSDIYAIWDILSYHF